MAIKVALGERSYRIVLATTFGKLPAELQRLGLPRYIWIISHKHLLLSPFGQKLLQALRSYGRHTAALTLPASESSKSLASAERLIEGISRGSSMRIPLIVAFGGGVVGDVAGFVASVFRRGIPYIQVPTTLLAQVDSGIGGKTGVDLSYAKNLVGAFYQPRLVYNNLRALQSLPARERKSGIAEVIKYGVIADGGLFAFLERYMDACLDLRPNATRTMVERSCRIKAQVVSRDELETKEERVRLNFGHTLGHALEAAAHYRGFTHGEAIAIGMCAAANLAQELGVCTESLARRITGLIKSAGLPIRAQGISRAAVERALRYDKKSTRGLSRWVLPVRIGGVIVREGVKPALVSRVLADCID